MSNNLKYVKVRVSLNENEESIQEFLWALKMDNGNYEIHNIPFLCYGLNYKDIVEVELEENDETPKVIRVVETKGNQTYRLSFDRTLNIDTRKSAIEKIVSLGSSCEGQDGFVFSFNVEIKSCDAIFNLLEKYEEEEYLSFETCEERVSGSFNGK